MRATDLDLRELLQFDPKGGVIRFANERALLLDAVAMGLLRRELIDTLGFTAARAVLTRFGYAHGWRTADSLEHGFPWDSDDDWKRAGGWLHTLQGQVRVEPATWDPGLGPKPIALSIWQDSYEAEQHLLHIGRAEEAVCWTLTGFASGYLSRAHGNDIYCLEERCRGKGDAVCRVVGRPIDEWGEAFADHLPFYKKACMESALAQVTEQLKRAERTLRTRRQALGEAAADVRETSGLGTHSAAMGRVLDLARRVAQVDTTVLITGESGVGKERIARVIHDESARTAGAFVAINCGAVPETLLESELFGHARGSFTGATQDRPGLFEAANNGTLLLDEIGEVPPAMQVKLLRVLQEREIRRVGENKNRRVDVRVVAATNRDLVEEIRAARFRQDLYYRLRVVELLLPPLRERAEDVPALALRFLAQVCERLGRAAPRLGDGALAALVRHGWPGNVRELRNAIEQAAVLASGPVIGEDDLRLDGAPANAPPADPAAGSTGLPFSEAKRRAVERFERAFLLN
ncbi:MAG TPA: sigma-54-dependent Fis family transcriptional regulator, partial [Planctomycetota bacterium]|nr:sigma-54-dependent Fis family transcriptional regulator [Planctomycetota bacterium]